MPSESAFDPAPDYPWPSLNLERLQEKLHGLQLEYHPVIGSTNDRAKSLSADAIGERGRLILTDRQTAGRGRGDNRWWTGAGSLACSLVFFPEKRGIAPERRGELSLAAAVAVVDAIQPLIAPHVAGLHWPNDVYIQDRKLSGILIETLPDGRHIIGLGLNVNNSFQSAPPDLKETIASLIDLSGREHALTDVLAAWLERLHVVLKQLAEEPDILGARFNEYCLQHGKLLTVYQGTGKIFGICRGIAADGALLLEQGERGIIRVMTGSLRRSE